MRIVTKSSPNQSARIHGEKAVRLIVCHTPEGSYSSAIGTCMNPSAQVSYHRLYKKDGTEATQLVPWNRKAWHAGAVNSLSDGLSLEGFARRFTLSDPGTQEFAKGVAERLIARKLKPQWTTDPQKGGFCRHGDLQRDRSDPTPDIAEWKQFAEIVRAQYRRLLDEPGRLPGPSPKPAEFWLWADWVNGGREGPRPPLAHSFRAALRVGGWPWQALEAWNEQHS